MPYFNADVYITRHFHYEAIEAKDESEAEAIAADFAAQDISIETYDVQVKELTQGKLFNENLSSK